MATHPKGIVAVNGRRPARRERQAQHPVTVRLASLDLDGWELESSVARHQGSPTTFWIPPETEHRGLRRGQAVKRLFRIRVEDEAGEMEVLTERMWVYVTGREGGDYLGRLQSRPESTDELSPGTAVRFRPEHVADVADPPGDYRSL